MSPMESGHISVQMNIGDSGLANFWESWSDLELGLAEKQPDRTMQYLFFKQIGDLPCLQTHLAPYKIARHGDPIKTYEHLTSIVTNYLDDVTMARNRQGTRKQLQNGQTKVFISGAAAELTQSRRAKSQERKAVAAQAPPTPAAHETSG